MLFRDTPIGARYIQDVLLRPLSNQRFGTDWEYLMNASLGQDRADMQERIGDLLGSLISKVVLASWIHTYARDKARPKKNKELDKALLLLRQNLELASQSILEICVARKLQLESIASRADLALSYVLNSRDSDVILYDESNLSREYSLFRYKVMEEVPPSYLSIMFREEISRYLGVHL
jgi:hypothetical protein